VELKGVGPSLVSVSERTTGEGHVGQLTRPRAFSQSAMHSLERSDRGNTQALAELAQVREEHRYSSQTDMLFTNLNIISLEFDICNRGILYFFLS